MLLFSATFILIVHLNIPLTPPSCFLCSFQAVKATDVVRGGKAAGTGGLGKEQSGRAEKYEGGPSAAGAPQGRHHLGRTLQHCWETQAVNVCCYHIDQPPSVPETCLVLTWNWKKSCTLTMKQLTVTVSVSHTDACLLALWQGRVHSTRC